MENAPKVGEQLDLELLTGDRLRGCVEWVQGRDVGLRFDEAADMFALITRNLVHQPGDDRRMPRVELNCPAWLEAGSRREIVSVRNFSDGGACIETRAPLVVHEQIVVTLDGFRPAPAVVRWVQGRAAGIAFTPDLPWQELMPWLRRRQPPQACRAKAAPPARGHAARRRRSGEGSRSIFRPGCGGIARWSIEVASSTRARSASSHTGAVDFRTAVLDHAGRAWKAGRRAWFEVDGYHASPASSRSRCTGRAGAGARGRPPRAQSGIVGGQRIGGFALVGLRERSRKRSGDQRRPSRADGGAAHQVARAALVRGRARLGLP
jgi:hypothetical protein